MSSLNNYKVLRINLVSAALLVLGKDLYSMIGNPTTEAEFNASFTKHDNEDWSGFWDQIESALANGGALPMAVLRQERDEKLAESDWMGVSDYSISDAWTTYRTALRDLPANNTSASWNGATLGNTNWPTEPS
tara:strand:+ start:802 stop:1200 length:399 start_codon:yes stop_codon:yes gene_type:complete